jgi:glycosidase
VFPERFRNGAPHSDPQAGDLGGPPPAGWGITPWSWDWYEPEPWAQSRGDFRHSVYWRRFGGDLVGLREKLDYLEDLGVNAIYLNPVFSAPSLHKYDASLFHHIDPTLGPDRDGDVAALAAADESEDPSTWIWTAADRCFLDLVREVHRRGMHIILDGVFNHTGRHFFAFADLLKNGKASRYRDWYRITGWKRDGSFSYRGWFGHQSLPEFARTRHGLAGPVRDYIFNITRRWMAPHGDCSEGIDGWRLDVAYCVPMGFWREWRKLVKGLNPDAYTTAEIVTTARTYLRGDTFDAVMNYMWLYPVEQFFAPAPRPLDAAGLKSQLNRLRRAYPARVTPVLQNLLDSHDVGRIATMLENPDTPRGKWDDYFSAGRTGRHPELVTKKPRPRTYAILRQLVLFQMTYPGAPMIYYGTEVGMWGANDPDNRQPMLWDDIAYRPERMDHKGVVDAAGRAPDRELLNFYKKAIRLRKEHPALRHGRLRWLTHEHPRVAAFERVGGSSRITAVFNASDHVVTYNLKWESIDLWREGMECRRGPVEIGPRGWLVAMRKHQARNAENR